jgi:transposase-like protein
MDRQTRYPKEVRERAVRLVFEHEREYSSQWAAITSIASKLGMTPETLRILSRELPPSSLFTLVVRLPAPLRGD